MATLKELAKKQAVFTGGHRLCAGCGAGTIMHQVSIAAEDPLVVGFATGCVEVSTFLYPFSAWKCSFVHNAFENAGATVSGVETAYRALKKKGKVKDKMKFIAFGGDGGTYDIGLQSLSGAMERGHDMLYVCYNNNAYMNTGIQRSSATPKGADTTTCPAGSKIPGKPQYQKDLTAIMAAHKIPYVAQASPSNWSDLVKKVQTALSIEGPKFINIISPCPLGWRYPNEKMVEVAKLAVDTGFWPLYEVRNGTEWKITYKPAKLRPMTAWAKSQGRFKHLFSPENSDILEDVQRETIADWKELLKKAGEEVPETIELTEE